MICGQCPKTYYGHTMSNMCMDAATQCDTVQMTEMLYENSFTKTYCFHRNDNSPTYSELERMNST